MSQNAPATTQSDETFAMADAYLHHRIDAAPRQWKAVADRITEGLARATAMGGALFGIWRSQIGRPRDELNAITVWSDIEAGRREVDRVLAATGEVVRHETMPMAPTLRPTMRVAPTRQGNYAFRWFETPARHWDEFLMLCEGAWPDFEASYDSQVIGLWRVGEPPPEPTAEPVRSLLLTRRPDLAMWERSKLPEGAVETAVREMLNRRYDLCDATVVYTTTLITAADRQDNARWT